MSSAALKDRAEPRTRAMLRASLHDDDIVRDACIIDVSTRGLLATTAQPPTRGQFVELRVGQHILTGQVRWSSERRFGVALRERVSVVSLLEGGSGSVRLAGSTGARKQSGTLAAGLRKNPQSMGRLGQYALLGCFALAAAHTIAGISQEGLSPLAKVIAALNGASVD